jgi:aryl-alcohol dehydrogenase-like predicted oxidoreductase
MMETVERLVTFAERSGHSILELAISWLLSHAQVPSVIAGATSPGQVRANAAASEWLLSTDDLMTVRSLT